MKRLRRKIRVDLKLETNTHKIVASPLLSGQILTIIIAIMIFLASGAYFGTFFFNKFLQSMDVSLSQEISIEVPRIEGLNHKERLEKTARISQEINGIDTVRILSEGEVRNLLTPWLGENTSWEELVLPGLIALKISDKSAIPKLKEALKLAVPEVWLDDHAQWKQNIKTAKTYISTATFLVFVLLSAVAALTIIFSTRATMSGAHEIIDVLDYMGATHAFISRQFAWHFLKHGMFGSATGVSVFMLTLGVFGLLYGENAPETYTLAYFIPVPTALELGTLFHLTMLIPITAALCAFTSFIVAQETLKNRCLK